MRPPFNDQAFFTLISGFVRRYPSSWPRCRAPSSRILIFLVLSVVLTGSGCGVLEPDADFTLTVAGHVRTPEGNPVAGASVRLGHQDFLSQQSGTLAHATTSSGGAFSFTVTAPDGYASPNCATMTVYTSVGEVESAYPLAWSDKCTPDTRSVEGITVTLETND